MTDLLANLALGFQVAAHPYNLGFCLLGALVGTLVGVLPGIGTVATVAMLLPITFGLPPVGALIMLAGIYYGAQYGGSTTSILVNIPGEATSVVTTLDGFQMAKQGRAGPALAIAAISSGTGRAASTSGAKCCCISSGPGAVQPGWSAPQNRATTQPSWGSTRHSAAGCSLMSCLSAVQLGWPCSQAMASCASCRAGNSPAARRRFASSFRYRRLGRPGSGRVDAAALPHARWSAQSGQERLAVDRHHTAGELAALPADLEASGTATRKHTPAMFSRNPRKCRNPRKRRRSQRGSGRPGPPPGRRGLRRPRWPAPPA